MSTLFRIPADVAFMVCSYAFPFPTVDTATLVPSTLCIYLTDDLLPTHFRDYAQSPSISF